MASNTKKQIHVSPGIYFSESELSVATKSLGITHLGVVGETLKGPAFQPISIGSWSQFQSYFGGTSTEKFKGSQYPKYELPYIAKTYLEQSQNLSVCRVLGLSGVNAGPAWIISAYKKEEVPTQNEGEYIKVGDEYYKWDVDNEVYVQITVAEKTEVPVQNEGEYIKVGDVYYEWNTDNEEYVQITIVEKTGDYTYTQDNPLVIAVLRSRGEHKKAAFIRSKEGKECSDLYEYDKILYYAKKVKIEKSKYLKLNGTCEKEFESNSHDLDIDVNNYGTFTLSVSTYTDDDDTFSKSYSVSFNPGDKNYIYNVIGGSAEDGDAEIYVEELYDVALQQLIEKQEIDTLGKEGELPMFDDARIVPNHIACDDILTEDESMLKKRDVGKRFLFSKELSVNNEDSTKLLTVHTYNGQTWVPADGQDGHIYTVVAYTTPSGTREYYYGEYVNKEDVLHTPERDDEDIVKEAVYVNSDNMYYIKKDANSTVQPVTLDFNNYKEQYRFSSTPWIVSELKGSAEHVELTKLFRFHTISDGDNSRSEVKISIENIEPELGTFDVLVRDFYDTDNSPVILEKYRGCNLVPNTENYLALKIGSFDEAYETKSRYVTVEINENDVTKSSVPAGFLGFPVRNYKGTAIVQPTGVEFQKPYLQYNTLVNEDIRIKKQYFGMSDLVGIDDDVLKYKGVEAYNDEPNGLTPSFHLDSRIFEGQPDENGVVEDTSGNKQTVSVDGVKGYQWVTVNKNNTVGNFDIEPRLGTEGLMVNSIYEDKRYRKFTVCFYGGFDGWDYYRQSRSNSDDFKYQKYRGKINPITGEGTNFSVIANPEAYNFDRSEKVINSDYYAYLSGIREFANPKEIDINVFATPGIDYVNQNLLVQETIEMIEEERADSIYVITTPDKPYGAGDNKSEMFTAEDAVDNLEDSEIDTNWGCTYFPWIKYYDAVNNQYIYLPPTRDVVKNMAYTDNTSAPWFAASGWNRGITDGIRSRKNLVLAEQDELYGGRINFVNNFAEEGMRIWGNNNLQLTPTDTHMNKISTRRCLIRLRKLISIACIGLIFEPNDPTCVAAFRSAVQPILEDFVARRALVDAKLVIDDSQEARDRLEINAQIYLKFTPTLEYINIGLVASSSGVSFDDL